MAGETWWLATVAAREAARAAALGADPAARRLRRAARAVRRRRVAPRVADDGTATVRLPIPALVAASAWGPRPAHARMEPQR